MRTVQRSEIVSRLDLSRNYYKSNPQFNNWLSITGSVAVSRNPDISAQITY
jgi:hypothetical protein